MTNNVNTNTPNHSYGVGGKFCFACGARINGATVCPQCATRQDMARFVINMNDYENVQQPQPVQRQPQRQEQQVYYGPAVPNPAWRVNPYEETVASEDLTEGKVYAVAAYMLGLLGILIAALVGKDSRFARFHAKQAMALCLVEAAGFMLLLLGMSKAWLMSIVAVFVLRVWMVIKSIKGKMTPVPLVGRIKWLQ